MPQQAAQDFLSLLDRKVALVIARVEESEVHRTILDPSTPLPLLIATIRSILFEVGSYGPHITEATFTAIGRLRGHEEFMRPLTSQLLDEVLHPDMAVKGYLQLGGDRVSLGSRRISPEAFAVGAVCRSLGGHERPFCYLGYMFLLEGTTAVLAERYRAALEAKGSEVEFVTAHAREDEEHTRYLRDQIARIVRQVPDAAPAIEYGFDCLAAVYPLPVWSAALSRARSEAHDAAR
jgi:hypothetical protein